MSKKKAVILFSGGLDSTTILYYAKDKGFKPHCLIFDYGQRHAKEIKRAVRIAKLTKATYQVLKITLPWQGSSLLNPAVKLPKHKVVNPNEIPSTYVPARNIIFLSFAASCAEAIGAEAIFIGANAVDYSGYPDCRPEFFKAYSHMLKKGSKAGVENQKLKIYTPLVKKTKAQIIRLGLKLKVPYHLTWSCYEGDAKSCGVCDSCVLRQKGFEEAGSIDPVR